MLFFQKTMMPGLSPGWFHGSLLRCMIHYLIVVQWGEVKTGS
jgi:hypothetical protein